MITKAIIVSVILGACFIAFGCSVFFFGKKAKRTACGTPPKETMQEKKSKEKSKKFECPSQKAGLCAQEDDTGGLDMANKNRLYETE